MGIERKTTILNSEFFPSFVKLTYHGADGKFIIKFGKIQRLHPFIRLVEITKKNKLKLVLLWRDKLKTGKSRLTNGNQAG